MVSYQRTRGSISKSGAGSGSVGSKSAVCLIALGWRRGWAARGCEEAWIDRLTDIFQGEAEGGKVPCTLAPSSGHPREGVLFVSYQ
jgi:hypothetical protein